MYVREKVQVLLQIIAKYLLRINYSYNETQVQSDKHLWRKYWSKSGQSRL